MIQTREYTVTKINTKGIAVSAGGTSSLNLEELGQFEIIRAFFVDNLGRIYQ